ncbi:MAG: ABC transporter permease [Treponema sp.]|jgi:phospholipid/cholesterol/gamma-HCH transport system permease protein|nr:ABC transporter permease [Treponema sp.]
MKLKITFLDSFFYALGFFGRILRGVAYFITRGQASFKILIMQILFTFVEALSLSSLLALGIGGAINIIGMPFLAQVGQQELIYSLLIGIITRELGPLLTMFIITARSATAIATEMAGMVIGHEIEAYISVGIDPIEHLAVPRFLGVTASLFLLNFYFTIFGLVVSFIVAQFFNPMPPSIYFGHLLQALTLPDLLVSIIKSISFGMIIATVAVMEGLAVERASTEIPVAGLRAVTSAFGLCIVADIVLSALYYLK